jgi:hypothetical protein
LATHSKLVSIVEVGSASTWTLPSLKWAGLELEGLK